MSLANLKANLSTGLQKLKQQAETKARAVDDRYWKVGFDKEKGTGSAVVRFLPAPQGEEFPYVRVYSHNFRGNGGKYFNELSLSTIGKRDALGLLNWKLWNSGIESDKALASKMKRKVEHTANVLVINDTANPDNNGKVFLMKYGPQIHEIMDTAMFPPEGSVDAPLNPFDPWEGADFVFRVYGKKIPDSRTGQPTIVPSYEKSSFKSPSAIGSDEKIEEIWSKCYPLQPFIAPELFLSEEEFKKKLFDVLGPTIGSGIPVVEGWVAPSQHQVENRGVAPKQKEELFDDTPPFDIDEPSPPKQTKNTVATISNDSDDDIEFLKGLL
jgi:gp32 DNA binding protein like